MKIIECNDLILSDITFEIESENDKLTMSYNRLEDKEGNINWDYSFSSEPVEPEEMRNLEDEYQRYKNEKD